MTDTVEMCTIPTLYFIFVYSLYLSIYLSIYPSIFLSIYLYIYVSIYFPIFFSKQTCARSTTLYLLFTYTYIYIYIYIFLYVYFSLLDQTASIPAGRFVGNLQSGQQDFGGRVYLAGQQYVNIKDFGFQGAARTHFWLGARGKYR